jgi:hypothetical protein
MTFLTAVGFAQIHGMSDDAKSSAGLWFRSWLPEQIVEL